jgi:hypothetical protein
MTTSHDSTQGRAEKRSTVQQLPLSSTYKQCKFYRVGYDFLHNGLLIMAHSPQQASSPCRAPLQPPPYLLVGLCFFPGSETSALGLRTHELLGDKYIGTLIWQDYHMMYCCLNSESHSLPLYTPFSCLQVSQSLSQICSPVTHSLFPSAPQSPTHFLSSALQSTS